MAPRYSDSPFVLTSGVKGWDANSSPWRPFDCEKQVLAEFSPSSSTKARWVGSSGAASAVISSWSGRAGSRTFDAAASPSFAGSTAAIGNPHRSRILWSPLTPSSNLPVKGVPRGQKVASRDGAASSSRCAHPWIGVCTAIASGGEGQTAVVASEIAPAEDSPKRSLRFSLRSWQVSNSRVGAADSSSSTGGYSSG